MSDATRATILFVDDSPTMRGMIRMALPDMNYPAASCGVSARRDKNFPEGVTPNVLIGGPVRDSPGFPLSKRSAISSQHSASNGRRERSPRGRWALPRETGAAVPRGKLPQGEARIRRAARSGADG